MPRSSSASDVLAHLDGSRLAKRRLRQLLALTASACTGREACRALGIGKSQLYALRSRAYQAALHALEPRPAGRPRKPTGDQATELRDLRARVRCLEQELARERARCLVAELIGDPPSHRS